MTMMLSDLRILVTGANGFIGRNLCLRLNELQNITISTFVRGDSVATLPHLVSQADAIVHLAGENRPLGESAFSDVNVGLTSSLCDAIRHECAASGRHVPLVLASSIQAVLKNPYGRSKFAAEQAVYSLNEATGNPCTVFRLPGVFGKWCRPNYNSVVATFCHNLARGLPIQINDPAAELRLVYVDDVVTALIAALEASPAGCGEATVAPEYTITVGQLAAQIRLFADCRTTLMSHRVGTGLVRALYATYISYLPTDQFSYPIAQHKDPRGMFVEMLKTLDSGQFSYFTAYPGITRGGHYHHTKTEKFLVVKGEAMFRFRHLLTNELVEIYSNGNSPMVVDTIPGWIHDITNVGNEEMIVLLWANENFDPQVPDTVVTAINP
jgi:UDP-2-acetamido-2,6-beta-L-arabino-hexul-4-ose reductase